MLALGKEHPTNCPPHQCRHPERQRSPNNRHPPGMSAKRRLSCRVAAAALAGALGRQADRPVSSIVQRYVTLHDDVRVKRTVKLRRCMRLAATDTPMMRTDPWLTHCAGLRARASRAALRAPASRLWPLTPSPSAPRLVDMPFRTGVSATRRTSFPRCAGGSAHGENSPFSRADRRGTYQENCYPCGRSKVLPTCPLAEGGAPMLSAGSRRSMSLWKTPSNAGS